MKLVTMHWTSTVMVPLLPKMIEPEKLVQPLIERKMMRGGHAPMAGITSQLEALMKPVLMTPRVGSEDCQANWGVATLPRSVMVAEDPARPGTEPKKDWLVGPLGKP